MNGPTRTTCKIALVAAALGCAALVLAFASGQATSRRQARDFTFEDINPASSTHGSKLTLNELYRDEGLVLQFVASWCGPCREELPDLQRFHEAGGVPLVLIAADEYGYTESVLIVAERAGLTVPILFVPVEPAAELETFYDHEILPATYLIDPAGAIRDMHEGAWSAARLSAAVESKLH